MDNKIYWQCEMSKKKENVVLVLSLFMIVSRNKVGITTMQETLLELKLLKQWRR